MRINCHMYNEIKEQPKVFSRILKNINSLENITNSLKKIQFNSILFTGCGSSYYVGILSSYIVNILTDKIALVLPSSEIMFYDFKSFKNTLLVAFSRSGETTETILAIKKAKKNGWKVLGITNRINSTLYNQSDIKLYINAGEEKSIIMTKTFSSMALISTLLGILFADEKHLINSASKLPQLTEKIFSYEKEIEKLSEDYINKRFVVLGRGINFGVALEGALKLRETSCLSVNAFSTLEFRHGPISLVDDNLVVIGLLPKTNGFDNDLSMFHEIIEKGGHLILITNADVNLDADLLIKYPYVDEIFTPVINIIPIQLLAFYIAIKKGLNPDKPRHLVKVVKI